MSSSRTYYFEGLSRDTLALFFLIRDIDPFLFKVIVLAQKEHEVWHVSAEDLENEATLAAGSSRNSRTPKCSMPERLYRELSGQEAVLYR